MESIKRMVSTLRADAEAAVQRAEAAEAKIKQCEQAMADKDIHAEQLERQTQRAEAERDVWEKKYDEAQAKYQQSKAELDQFIASMQSI